MKKYLLSIGISFSIGLGVGYIIAHHYTAQRIVVLEEKVEGLEEKLRETTPAITEKENKKSAYQELQQWDNMLGVLLRKI